MWFNRTRVGPKTTALTGGGLWGPFRLPTEDTGVGRSWDDVPVDAGTWWVLLSSCEAPKVTQ